MSFEDQEILQAFIEESVEHLADIETDLLAIEKPPAFATATQGGEFDAQGL